ncbi:MAG: tyrosine-type recombinase/integrase [Nitrospiraceae bacterium]|nr:tyrosine-type recombinase/integrase [Nitrospiraceae bacterium]
MATIRKRKGKNKTVYQAIVRRKGYDQVAETFPTKWEAQKWALNVEEAMRLGKWYSWDVCEDLTLSVALKRYLDFISVLKAPSTCARERYAARAILDILPGDMSISHINAKVIANYRDVRMASVSSTTVLKELALLSSLFEVAASEWGVKVANPVRAIKKPKPRPGRTRFLSQDEIDRLLKVAAKSRQVKLSLFLEMLLQTAMRPGEAAKCRWSDIDFQNYNILIGTTKNGQPRSVPISKILGKKLKRAWDQRDVENPFVFFPRNPSARLMLRPQELFRGAWEYTRLKAGLEDVHLHDLRHTAATYLLANGVDVRTVQEILGHKTLAMVQRYTHVLPDRKRSAVEKMPEIPDNYD